MIINRQVIDGHCDTVGLLNAQKKERAFKKHNIKGHLDLPRMRQGGIKLQFFALYIKEELASAGSLRYCLSLLDSYYKMMEPCRDQVQTIYNLSDLQEVISGPKTGALISVEGGEALQGELFVLRALFRLGVRSLGLTWNHRNRLAVGVGENSPGEGLTSFGKKVVKEMNSLGMLIDLAHVNEKGFFEAAVASSAPVIVSHANARALCEHPRNLTDEQLKKLKDVNGVIGLTYYPEFIAAHDAGLDDLLNHFVYVEELIGTDNLGLGSDFDGIDKVIEGLEDAACVPRLIEGLLVCGFSPAEIEKITHKNFLRVLENTLPR